MRAATARTPRSYFIEANPRLQVEHTVTEEVTGIDLVQTQLRIAQGRSLGELGLAQRDVPEPRGFAVQVRVNTETMTADGAVRPAGGTLAAFEAPSGPGVRVDTAAYAGYATNPAFDSLLAKLVVSTPSSDVADAFARAYRALCEFRIEGVEHEHRAAAEHRSGTRRWPRGGRTRGSSRSTRRSCRAARRSTGGCFFEAEPAPRAGHAGARIDASDPLAVLQHGKSERADAAACPARAAPTRPTGW